MRKTHTKEELKVPRGSGKLGLIFRLRVIKPILDRVPENEKCSVCGMMKLHSCLTPFNSLYSCQCPNEVPHQGHTP